MVRTAPAQRLGDMIREGLPEDPIHVPTIGTVQILVQGSAAVRARSAVVWIGVPGKGLDEGPRRPRREVECAVCVRSMQLKEHDRLVGSWVVRCDPANESAHRVDRIRSAQGSHSGTLRRRGDRRPPPHARPQPSRRLAYYLINLHGTGGAAVGYQDRTAPRTLDQATIRMPFVPDETLGRASRLGEAFIVEPHSPIKLRRAAEQLAQQLRREIRSDATPYDAEEPGDCVVVLIGSRDFLVGYGELIAGAIGIDPAMAIDGAAEPIPVACWVYLHPARLGDIPAENITA